MWVGVDVTLVQQAVPVLGRDALRVRWRQVEKDVVDQRRQRAAGAEIGDGGADHFPREPSALSVQLGFVQAGQQCFDFVLVAGHAMRLAGNRRHEGQMRVTEVHLFAVAVGPDAIFRVDEDCRVVSNP